MIEKGQMIVVEYLVLALESEVLHYHKAYHVPWVFELLPSKPTLELTGSSRLQKNHFKPSLLATWLVHFQRRSSRVSFVAWAIVSLETSKEMLPTEARLLDQEEAKVAKSCSSWPFRHSKKLATPPSTQKFEIKGSFLKSSRLSVDPAKIEAIVEWPTPQNVYEVQSFMGLAGYYRKYVEGFSRIAAPITSLQKKEKRFEWTEKCEDSFHLLKKKLTTTPVLTIPDPNGHFVIITDASSEGVGAVLM
ncbi:uncharacterized protein LOC131859790 [Cryptomeria japonica]|uniref:uncharacterized protein LOC131859790 n=1 Tax=Cryptomeria japonica TaxID=3369 RepID=UPI0027DA9547|nr:uncharacterized protein LOC131859790 [Cryptomeria japonica]